MGNLLYPFIKPFRFGVALAADKIENLGMLLNDIRGNPARIKDCIMDAFIICHMFPKIVHAHIHQFHRVKGTAALFWRGCRVGSLTGKGKGRLDIGLVTACCNSIHRCRMPRKGSIHIVKKAFPRHIGLPASAFFGRTAIDPHRPLVRMGF